MTMPLEWVVVPADIAPHGHPQGDRDRGELVDSRIWDGGKTVKVCATRVEDYDSGFEMGGRAGGGEAAAAARRSQ